MYEVVVTAHTEDGDSAARIFPKALDEGLRYLGVFECLGASYCFGQGDLIAFHVLHPTRFPQLTQGF